MSSAVYPTTPVKDVVYPLNQVGLKIFTNYSD